MTDPDITIPAFLDAKLRPKRRRILRDDPEWSPVTLPCRPTSERWHRADRFRVHLHDEATRIGSGYRALWVLVGRKRVGLSDGKTTQVIPRHLWNDNLARSAIKLEG